MLTFTRVKASCRCQPVPTMCVLLIKFMPVTALNSAAKPENDCMWYAMTPSNQVVERGTLLCNAVSLHPLVYHGAAGARVCHDSPPKKCLSCLARLKPARLTGRSAVRIRGRAPGREQMRLVVEQILQEGAGCASSRRLVEVQRAGAHVARLWATGACASRAEVGGLGWADTGSARVTTRIGP